MARSLANLILDVKDELGTDIAALFTSDDEYERYLNQGQRRLSQYDEETITLTWVAGDREVSLPADLAHVDRVIPDLGVRIPTYRVFGGALRFLDPEGASEGGTATLLYHSYYPAITSSAASELTDEQDNAIVAFACYRFFRRLASSRADYQRYSTLLGQNGVDIEELSAIAEDYFSEFESARDSLPAEEPVTFYGD